MEEEESTVPRPTVIQNLLPWLEISSAFEGRVLKCFIPNSKNIRDPIVFLEASQVPFILNVHKFLSQFSNAKIYCSLETEFMIVKKPSDEVVSQSIFLTTSKSEIVNTCDNLGQWFVGNVSDILLKKFSEFSVRGSGFSLSKLLGLNVHLYAFEPFIKPGKFIPVPRSIQLKHAVVNVKNEDEKCFLWCLSCFVHHKRNPTARSRYIPSTYRTTFDELEESLNWSGLSWPLSLDQISKFEKNNPRFSINVYELDEGSSSRTTVRGPMYYSRKKSEQHVNLLLLTSAAGISHFCWIRNLGKLVRSQLTSKRNRIDVCDRSLQIFATLNSYALTNEIVT